MCESEELSAHGPAKGMVIDFEDLARAVAPILENELDHWHLNDTTGLENPTSEELARWIYDKLKPSLPHLSKVIVEETCTTRCEYQP